MMSVFWLLIVCLCAFGAYLIVGSGFTGAKSERLNNYGFVGYAVLLIFTVSMTMRVFFKTRRSQAKPAE